MGRLRYLPQRDCFCSGFTKGEVERCVLHAYVGHDRGHRIERVLHVHGRGVRDRDRQCDVLSRERGRTEVVSPPGELKARVIALHRIEPTSSTRCQRTTRLAHGDAHAVCDAHSSIERCVEKIGEVIGQQHPTGTRSPDRLRCKLEVVRGGKQRCRATQMRHIGLKDKANGDAHPRSRCTKKFRKRCARIGVWPIPQSIDTMT